MIKGIMAIDENAGISKGQSMPWPKNSIDLKWFKQNTLNNVVIMGRKTWEDPFMPTPLKSRINVLVTKIHHYLWVIIFSGDIIQQIKISKNMKIKMFYNEWIRNNQFNLDLIEEFYLTESTVIMNVKNLKYL